MTKLSVNKDVLRKLDKIGLSLRFDEENDSIALFTQFGNVLTKQETLEVITGLMNFIESTDDNEILEYNQQPVLYSDYEKNEFEYSRKLRKTKQGHVFLYKELASNSFRFGESESVQRRMESLVNASPVALDFIVSFHAEDTVSLKEYLQQLFLHRIIENNWYALTDDDVTYIKEMKFFEGYEEFLQEKKQKREKEQFHCQNPACGKLVTDEMQTDYYYCGYCRDKFCSEECVEAHFKTHHLHR